MHELGRDFEAPDAHSSDSPVNSEQRIQNAAEANASDKYAMPGAPGDPPPPPDDGGGKDVQLYELEGDTFRYYDMKLGGEVRTTLDRKDALEPDAVAYLHKRDGTVREVGRLRYALDKHDCTLRGYTHAPEAYGVESALQSEVSERARDAGINNMRVWVPDGDAGAAKPWSSHGFLEEQRYSGAHGTFWNRRL